MSTFVPGIVPDPFHAGATQVVQITGNQTCGCCGHGCVRLWSVHRGGIVTPARVAIAGGVAVGGTVLGLGAAGTFSSAPAVSG